MLLAQTMNLKRAFFSHFQKRHLRQAVCRLQELEERYSAAETRVNVPFDFRGKGFFKSIKPMQSLYEISQLYTMLLARRPKVVVEIGTCHGGTLYLWCQAADPGATLISIDLPAGEFGGGYVDARAGLYQLFAREGQALHLLRSDSHATATFEKVQQVLGSRPVDFLFIDGDHTYQGVKQDFLLYRPLVAPDGCIALHDIAARPELPRIEVWRFWQELKAQFTAGLKAGPRPREQLKEFLDPGPGCRPIGIGLIQSRA